jgi:predicted DNA repair protein MutK
MRSARRIWYIRRLGVLVFDRSVEANINGLNIVRALPVVLEIAFGAAAVRTVFLGRSTGFFFSFLVKPTRGEAGVAS